jgi:hypothetical protein
VIREDFLIDIVDHKLIRNFSNSPSVIIPRDIEILCSGCFSWCQSLESVTFESNSRLARIEFRAFASSSLQSIVIPCGVQFIDGSAFRNMELSSISIESGNKRFVIRDDFLIDIVDHKLIRNFSNSPSVMIPCDIEILYSECFSWCQSLESVTFESNSRLRRIESEAFSFSSLRSILIPHTVEILCSECFSRCISIQSVSFESNSRLKRIESKALPSVSDRITIPSAVLFVAHDAIWDPSQLSLCDEDSCPEFGRWRGLRQSGIAVDFRRIERGGEFACASAHLPLDLTVFEEGSMIGEASSLYRRMKDGISIVVKSFDVSEFEVFEIEHEIENLSNLRHPLIAGPIGSSLAEGGQELKIGRLHAAGGSLAEAVSSKPVWWTPTAKAEAVVGIVLVLRFSHGLGLLHGDLNSRNILFDGGGRVQIADFSPMRRDGGFSEEGEGEGWSPRADVSAFAMVLFEIVTGHPLPQSSAAQAYGEVILPPDVPWFVSEIIEGGLRRMAGDELSFIDIFETLMKNDFGIVSGVDSDEVSAFVREVGSAGQCGEST